MELAYWFRRSCHLKEIVDSARRMTDDAQCMTDDGHWPITIAHQEHFVLRWAKNKIKKLDNSIVLIIVWIIPPTDTYYC